MWLSAPVEMEAQRHLWEVMVAGALLLELFQQLAAVEVEIISTAVLQRAAPEVAREIAQQQVI